MPQGYLHNEMDVKVLILFILARVKAPIDIDTIYEISYQDDSLNYFMLSECLTELTASAHILKDTNSRYLITEKGRKQGSVVEDSLAVPVSSRVLRQIEAVNARISQAEHILTSVEEISPVSWVATLDYMDNDTSLLKISLNAPSEILAKAMAENLKKNLKDIYKACMDAAMDTGRKSIREQS